LQASGGGVYLFDTPTNGGSLLTARTYGLQVADLSIGRVPDGSTTGCSPAHPGDAQTWRSLPWAIRPVCG